MIPTGIGIARLAKHGVGNFVGIKIFRCKIDHSDKIGPIHAIKGQGNVKGGVGDREGVGILSLHLNGKNCLIRRGVWTRIRRKFALLLDQSEIQDLRTAELMEQEESRFADESLRHNA